MPRMTAEQLAQWLEQSNLSDQHEAAKRRAGRLLADADVRTFRNWLSGTVPVPFGVSLVITLMRLAELTPDEIEALGERWRGSTAPSQAAVNVDASIDAELRNAIADRLNGVDHPLPARQESIVQVEASQPEIPSPTHPVDDDEFGLDMVPDALEALRNMED
jgi:hypothetical protein